MSSTETAADGVGAPLAHLVVGGWKHGEVVPIGGGPSARMAPLRATDGVLQWDTYVTERVQVGGRRFRVLVRPQDKAEGEDDLLRRAVGTLLHAPPDVIRAVEVVPAPDVAGEGR